MNVVKWYVKAAKRQTRVMEAKAKKPEELTKQEAIEIVKWEKEKERNTLIIGAVAFIAASARLKRAISKEAAKL